MNEPTPSMNNSEQSDQSTATANSEQVSKRRREPSKGGDTPWYKDIPKIAGVLGLVLAAGTLVERGCVREQEQTRQRLQELREVTSGLADIQSEYLEALAAAPSNIYALGVAKNTKRQMYIQTADALLEYRRVRQQASSQIFGALAAEMMSDGRYERARTYFSDALAAPGLDEATRPLLLRSLGQLYKIPNTKFANVDTARHYFQEALELLDERRDDTGHLSWAETILTEASLEITYGDPARAKTLAGEAIDRMKRVQSLSPLRTQLERIAAGFQRGEQYAQIQERGLVQTALQPGPVQPSQTTVGVEAPRRDLVIEVWAPVAGQVSGVAMVVAIDEKKAGELSNLTANRQLRLRDLSSGVHKFAFTEMNAYFIDPAKGPSMTGARFSCAGFFEVSPVSVVLRANVATGPNGLMCSLQ